MNRHFFVRHKTMLAMLLLAVTLLIPAKTYAFDLSKYTDDGDYFIMDEYANFDSHVTLYILYPSDYYLDGYTWQIFLGRTDENIENGEYGIQFAYETYKSNGTYIGTVGDGQLYQYGFDIENGNYRFCTNKDYDLDGSNYTVTPDYENPYNTPEDVDMSDEYTIAVNNETISVYTIDFQKDPDFAKNNLDALAAYAKEHDAETMGTTASDAGTDATDTTDTTDTSEGLEGFVDSLPVDLTEEDKEAIGEVADAINEELSAADTNTEGETPAIAEDEAATEEETATEEEEDATEEEKKSPKTLIFGGALFLFAVILAVKSKKSTRSFKDFDK